VDHVNPPQWNTANPPQSLRVIFDPVIQEWIDFRCQVMSDALRQVAAYAKSLNPEVAIEINPHGITGGNRAWEAGIDHARLLPWTEAFWTEEGNQPGMTPDGRLVSKIRSYKLARAFRNILFTYVAGDPLALAECLAFNQTLGFVGRDPLDAETLKYLAFYRKNRELFRGTRDTGGVALLRSYASITYNQARAQLGAVLAEQALIQARVPFELVFDRDLADLSRYKVLILPDSECLSDGQLAAIRGFVEKGGALVVIGQAGLYDQWRRLRVTPGLAGLIEGQAEGRAYQEQVHDVQDASAPMRKEIGMGRSVYLPALRFDGPLPVPGAYFATTNRYWKRPLNSEEFVEAVRWAARDSLPVQIGGPAWLVANLVQQPGQRRMLLHLVNYSKPMAPIKDVKVNSRLPVRSVQVFSPDADVVALAAGPHGGFVIPEVKTHAIAVMELQR
jgi:hypothetical protein